MTPEAFTARTLFSRVERCLAARARDPLLVCIPERVSFSGPALLREIRLVADRLARSGLVPGSRVLLSLSHPLSLTLILPALWSLDCVPILAEAGATRHELSDLARRLTPDRILGDEENLPAGARPALLAGLPLVRISRLRFRSMARLPRATVLVRTTSGSTGPPSGVALSGSQIVADTSQILSSLRIGADVPILGAVPMAHAYGFSTTLVPLLLHGNSLVLLERPLPEHFRSALGRYRSLFFPGVPYFYDLLCRAEIRSGILSHLAVCISAGAPLTAETALRFRERAGIPVRNFYGASECGAVSCDRTRDGLLPPGCVGTPLRGVSLRLEGRKGVPPSSESAKGRVGRIAVMGEAVTLGYVGRPGGVRLLRGRFVTGDLGRIDSRGRLHLLGRVDRLINVGGRKVRPEEIERVLVAAAGVRDAVAVGVPDPSRGEAVAAAVVVRPGVRPEDLLALCRRRLSPHKIPRRIQILADLPRTVRGKLDRARLRCLLSGGPDPLSGS